MHTPEYVFLSLSSHFLLDVAEVLEIIVSRDVLWCISIRVLELLPAYLNAHQDLSVFFISFFSFDTEICFSTVVG